jgi:hypothetical protein
VVTYAFVKIAMLISAVVYVVPEGEQGGIRTAR